MMQRRLLIVDDEEPVRFALSEFFATRSVEADCASTAQEADSLLDTYEHEIMVLDLRLSHGFDEGWGLIIRTRERHPNTAIIMLTGFGSPEIEARARELGVAAYLEKPQPLRVLADIVDEVRRGCRS